MEELSITWKPNNCKNFNKDDKENYDADDENLNEKISHLVPVINLKKYIVHKNDKGHNNESLDKKKEE